jgi:hypothetical protein
MNVYRITPLEKKNINVTYNVFEESANGESRGWNVSELYRWGYGCRSLNDAVSECEINNNCIYCEFDLSSEVDDLIAVYFEFDDGFSDEEKAEIEQNWDNGGPSWLFDGEHNWQVESTEFLICGPVKIDIVDEWSNEVIEENVQPKPFEPSNTVWPFPMGEFGKLD